MAPSDDRQLVAEAFFHACPLPAAVADASGRLVVANPRLAALLGYRPGELDGRPLSQLMHPDDRSISLPQFRGAEPSVPTVWVTRYRAASGEWVALRWYTAHDHDTGLLFGVAKQVHETDELSLRLTQMAYRDELTGLANRYLLLDTLERWLVQARAVGDALIVLLIDLDGLKSVNDSAGHEAGDALLASVGGSLERSTRVGDLAGRLAGDEFVVAAMHSGVDPSSARTMATRMAENVLAAVRQGVADVAAVGGASVGVAAYPWSAADVASVVRAADGAMYQAKQAGGNRMIVCHELATADG